VPVLSPAGNFHALHSLEIVVRSVIVAFCASRESSIIESIGKVWVKPDGLGEILNRSLIVASVASRKSTITESIGIVCSDADKLIRFFGAIRITP